jgi:hypothetical protein
MAYIYQADVWCDECGKAIIAELTSQEKAPEDPEDESSFDSDEFPKHYDAENEESDGPQNCADGHCAGNYGTFLQNQLTSHGYAYLKKMLNEDGETPSELVKEWANYYQFSYFKNEYSHPGDWLECRIDWLAKETNGPRSAELISLARDLASKLDGDTIQDLFQSDMDSDDYFKESGWYSPEMD